MRAIQYDNQWIYLENITEYEDDIIWNEFSVAKPNVYIDPEQMGQWDGIVRLYNRKKKRLARPFLSMLCDICNKHKLPLAIDDKRNPWRYKPLSAAEIDKHFLPNITLHDFQVSAIHSCLEPECGIFEIPTGGGKGELIAATVKAIPCPTVVLADQTVVIDQLKKRLDLREVASEVGAFFAGRRPHGGEPVVVGTVQSLFAPANLPPKPIKPLVGPDETQDEVDAKYEKKLIKWDSQVKGFNTRRTNAKFLQQFIKKAEMLLVDECDKATNDYYKTIFRSLFKGRRTYGYSGTPYDPNKPIENMIMQSFFGSVIYRESRHNLTKLGCIIPCTYNMLAFGMDGSIRDASAYDIAYDEWIINNRNFHSLITGLCLHHKKPDHGTLILVDRSELGHNLLASLSKAGLRAQFIYGETSLKNRTAALAKFEKRELDVLIGGKIVHRGLDLNGGCESLIIATGGKLQSSLYQQIGRAVRRNKLGKSIIYDFFFRDRKSVV